MIFKSLANDLTGKSSFQPLSKIQRETSLRCLVSLRQEQLPESRPYSDRSYTRNYFCVEDFWRHAKPRIDDLKSLANRLTGNNSLLPLGKLQTETVPAV